MCIRPRQGNPNKYTAPGDTLTDFFSDTGSTPVSSTNDLYTSHLDSYRDFFVGAFVRRQKSPKISSFEVAVLLPQYFSCALHCYSIFAKKHLRVTKGAEQLLLWSVELCQQLLDGIWYFSEGEDPAGLV